MIRINNTNWENLAISDIQNFLLNAETETFFFDNKEDNASSDKILKGICAFANTYGGYIFIGVNDDNTITGCSKWTEERIHNVVHDSLSPLPLIDVKKISINNTYILVIRVEEGERPPYITKNGQIYVRLASGSYPVKESETLNALYKKRLIHEEKVCKKIESALPEIKFEKINNMVGCIDVGVSMVTRSQLNFEKSFFAFDNTDIAEILSRNNNKYSISRVGNTYQITLGELAFNSQSNELPDAGINNYLVIFPDGSFFYRIMLINDVGTDKADISVIYTVEKVFEEVYRLIIGDDVENKFIYAEKYQKLHTFRQFVPYYNSIHDDDKEFFSKYLNKHTIKYGGNRIISGSRTPIEGYSKIDKNTFALYDIAFCKESLAELLMETSFLNLGYIDPF